MSNTIMDGEKKDLESNIAGLETQTILANKEVEDLKARVAELE